MSDDPVGGRVKQGWPHPTLSTPLRHLPLFSLSSRLYSPPFLLSPLFPFFLSLPHLSLSLLCLPLFPVSFLILHLLSVSPYYFSVSFLFFVFPFICFCSLSLFPSLPLTILSLVYLISFFVSLFPLFAFCCLSFPFLPLLPCPLIFS